MDRGEGREQGGKRAWKYKKKLEEERGVSWLGYSGRSRRRRKE